MATCPPPFWSLVLTQMKPVAGDPGGVPLGWPLFCFGVSLVGLTIRAYTVGHAAPGTSGRNRSRQVAEALNTTGAYSVVRNPLYLGNAVTWLGPALVPRVWWLVALGTLICWLHYERIILAEEKFLQAEFGPRYLDWADRTPAFLPAVGRWRAPSDPFNFRMVLRREYSGLFQLVLAFAVLNARQWQIASGRWTLSPFWAAALAIGTVVAGTLRILRKRTHWLEDRPGATDPDETELPETKWPA